MHIWICWDNLGKVLESLERMAEYLEGIWVSEDIED